MRAVCGVTILVVACLFSPGHPAVFSEHDWESYDLDWQWSGDICSTCAIPCNHTTPADDQTTSILRDFYRSTGNRTGCWNSSQWGNESSNPCSDCWPGVCCDEGKVVKLTLRRSDLCGTIPRGLAQLTDLKCLNLASNHLNGTLPTQVGAMQELKALSLRGNALEGNIPPSYGELSKLTSLNLASNHLNGTLPTQVGAMQELKALSLRNNSLEGNIPPSYGGLFKLTSLNLESNHLNGTLPTQVGAMQELKALSLRGNALKGNIPPSYGGLSKLTSLNLASNDLNGTLPTQVGAMQELKSLSLRGNALKGNIPTEFAKLNALQRMRLSENQLSGSIPLSLGGLTNLTMLSLGYNKLDGTIPPQLGNLIKLKVLTFNTNDIHGSLPAQLSSLTNLVILLGFVNELTGSIPPSYGGLSKLNSLAFSSNKLNGSIPSQLGDLENLSALTLDRNELTHHIPSTLGKLTKAIFGLKLNNNELNGSIPIELGNLSSSSVIHLERNHLSGTVPEELFRLSNLRSLKLSRNPKLSTKYNTTIFEGVLNSTLQELDLSHCNINGSLPFVNGWSESLQTLKLNDNRFSGTLPTQYGKMTNILSIDLQNNLGLAGSTIPPQWSTGLKNLTSLDLSNIGLVGGLPESWIDLDPNATNSIRLANDLEFQAHEIRRGTNRAVPKLKELYLADNQMNASAGETLSRVSTLRSLNVLVLTNNFLHGDICKRDMYAVSDDLFKGGGAVDNNLGSGSFFARRNVLPTFESLVVLRLNDNEIMGLPTQWKDNQQHERSAHRLEVFDVSNNSLNSEVDFDTWSKLSLSLFDLSANSFTTIRELDQSLELAKDVERGIMSGVPPEIILDKNCTCNGIAKINFETCEGPGAVAKSLNPLWKIDPSYYGYSKGCKCNPGFGGDNCSCEECEVGKYSNDSGTLRECLECPGESYSTDKGKTSCTICKDDTCHGHGSCLLAAADPSYNEDPEFKCECDFFYRLGGERCRWPGMLAILVAVSMVLFGALTAVAYRNRRLFVRKNEDFVQQQNEYTELRARAEEDIEDLRRTWRVEEDHCVFERVVASGAFGQVWKGRWLSHVVAIKEIFPLPDEDPELDDFDDVEVQVMVRLRHPRLCLFFGCGRLKESGRRFIVVEWCEGGSLFGVIHDAKQRKPWPWRLCSALDSAEGIAYLHENGLVHRDIKSLNVLVDAERRCKVADFGGARVFSHKRVLAPRTKASGSCGESTEAYSDEATFCGSSQSGKSTSSSDYASFLLATGVFGTPKWNAPELYMRRSAQLSPETDVFSFGVLLWELLTLREPWHETRGLSAWSSVSKGGRPRFTETEAAESPPGFVELLKECWAQEPESRPSMSVVVERLGTMLEHTNSQRHVSIGGLSVAIGPRSEIDGC